jgi:uncharacterized membrane protein
MNHPLLRVAARWLLAVSLVGVGVTHFTGPEPYMEIMPPPLAPWALELVYLSGFFEILGGLGLLWTRTRTLAGWGVLALLVAVFPANIYMATHGVGFAGMEPNPAALWLRLPLQFVLMAVAWWVSRPEPTAADQAPEGT